MQKLVGAFALVTALLGQAVTAAAQVDPQPVTIDGATTHIYKTAGTTELRLHVFSPAGAPEKRPAIVLFFGGGWTQGSILQFVPQAQHFASRGMVAIVADYRVRDRHQTPPYEAVADAKSAMRWVRAHAATLGVDPARILAGGGSSGGHIALATLMIDGFDDPKDDRSISPRPAALVLFNPAVDTAREALKERFGERGRDVSPQHHVRPGLPPMLIVHGKADAQVPYSEVETFCDRLQNAGAACELIGYDGAPHGFFNRPVNNGVWFRDTLLEADRFLTRLGYLPSPSPSEIR